MRRRPPTAIRGAVPSYWGSSEAVRSLPVLSTNCALGFYGFPWPATGVPNLTLAQLNEATQAWVELEYNCSEHSETRQTPIHRLLAGPSVVREAPSAEDTRRAFRLKADRRQRASDGTISVAGVRFEVPSCYRHLGRMTVRYARWDLSSVDLWDDALGVVLCTLYPVDREANADGFRRPVAPSCSSPTPPKPSGVAPLLRRYIDQYRQTGLPPAYLPKDDFSDLEDP